VNNAFPWGEFGRDDGRPFETTPSERWRPLLRSAIEGVLDVAQTVLPLMRNQGWGRIVNVSATIGADGLAGYSWYTAAKSALHGFTKTLAYEAGAAGVLVNCVLPGLTRTERIRHVDPGLQRVIARQTPIGRLLEPADVSSLIVYLGSAANTAVTGQLIRVSGGL
jgi:3-oxoacyl-[acyl-carrier protein] reductase